MAEATPRITAQYLQSFEHQTVRMVGKVTLLRGEQATIDAGGPITIHLNRDAHLQVGHAVEVIGKVQQDLTVRVFSSTDFGTNIDFAAIDAVVDATHRHKEIFYGDNNDM
ncbi:replication factor A protein 3 [Lineolata rhizophorae]|uniref:Replication factor A protein 3 n=1 Tax=Lineolata rhizophorae TaxID=578093 RepID=A0A6A6PE82_9PEZI|nr:replication factor A protein 3 [Lineolata rhizophorae]